MRIVALLVSILLAHRAGAAPPEAPDGNDLRIMSFNIRYDNAGAGITVREAAIDDTNRDGRWPSDHRPVTARIALPLTPGS